jgi:hypothetical protein
VLPFHVVLAHESMEVVGFVCVILTEERTEERFHFTTPYKVFPTGRIRGVGLPVAIDDMVTLLHDDVVRLATCHTNHQNPTKQTK